MKNIRLTGLGNALVDIEYQVSDEELAAFGVAKGAMTLTDAVRQQEMISILSSRDAHRCSGGSAANTVIAFAQFGGKAAYTSILGADHYGEFYASEFRQMDIDLSADLVSGETTGSCLVLITPDSERTLNTTLAVNQQYSPIHVHEDIVRRSQWIYIEGYKLTDDLGTEAVDMALFYAKKHGTHVAVSCSDGFIVDVFGDRLRDVLKRTDLVFANEREASSLAQEEHADDAYRKLSSDYSHVVVTKGAHGSRVKFNGIEAAVPAYVIDAVDATGAGDMYAGAFLYGVLHGHHPEHAARLASYASAQVVGQFGARLKTSHIDVRDTILNTATTR